MQEGASRYRRRILFVDSNGNLDPEAPPANYGRRRSRAVLYQLSGHYKQDSKHKIKLNNVSSTASFVYLQSTSDAFMSAPSCVAQLALFILTSIFFFFVFAKEPFMQSFLVVKKEFHNYFYNYFEKIQLYSFYSKKYIYI